MVEYVAAAAWVYLAAIHGRFWRVRRLLLPPSAPSPTHNVVAIIPARSEAHSIASAVQSLRRQVTHVIVVDDSSDDATAERARAAGATVVNAGPLPPGWTGKMRAVWTGVRSAPSCDFYLLTDADIVHGEGTVAALVERAIVHRLDLASVMVRLHCSSVAERLLVPAFVFFFFMLYPPAWIAARDRRTAGAAGGCILVRPHALERIGGIEAIRHELIDDCALASHVKRSGGAIWLGMSFATASVREYPGFRDIRAMIARTAFTQLRYSTLLLLVTVLGMLLLYVVPVLYTARGSIAAVATWLLMTALYLPMVRFYRQPLVTALLLPVAGLFYTAATLESALRYWTGRGGAWKGRNQAAAARSRRNASTATLSAPSDRATKK